VSDAYRHHSEAHQGCRRDTRDGNDFDADAVVRACSDDAYVSDARGGIRGIDAIRRRVNKEMVSDNVTIEPVEVIDRHDDTIVRGRCGGTDEKPNFPYELIMSNYISVRDGTIGRLALIRNQPSQPHQPAEQCAL